MPHKEIIDFLIGKTCMDHNACVNLVKLRKEAIMKNIKQLGQTKLGDVWHGYNYPESNPGSALDVCLCDFKSESPDLSLTSRGVFIYDPKSYAPHQKRQNLLIYGFTRDGRWVKVDIKFEIGNDRWTMDDNKTAVASYTSVSELIGRYDFLRPLRIFEALGRVANEHVEARRRLLREAEAMQRKCEMENEFLEHIVGPVGDVLHRGEFQKDDLVVFDESQPFVAKSKMGPKEPLKVIGTKPASGEAGHSQIVEVVDANGKLLHEYSGAFFKLHYRLR